LRVSDLVYCTLQNIGVQDDQVGKLTRLDGTRLLFLKQKIGIVRRIETNGLFASERLL